MRDLSQPADGIFHSAEQLGGLNAVERYQFEPRASQHAGSTAIERFDEAFSFLSNPLRRLRFFNSCV